MSIFKKRHVLSTAGVKSQKFDKLPIPEKDLTFSGCSWYSIDNTFNITVYKDKENNTWFLHHDGTWTKSWIANEI